MIRKAWLLLWLPICQFFYDEAVTAADPDCIAFWQRRIEATGRWAKPPGS